MEDNIKMPPSSIESEQSIIGAILLNKDSIMNVIEILKPEDFYADINKIIYKCMIDLNSRLEPIDIVTVQEEIKKQEKQENIEQFVSYMMDLISITLDSSNIKYYAEIVKQKSILRKLIKASNEIIDLGYGNAKAEDVLEIAEKKIFDISQERTGEDFKTIDSVLLETYDTIENLFINKKDITGITTGFNDLNRKINGFQKTDLLLIAARPAMGKTAFSLNLVLNAALKGDASVAVFSLEMSREQLVQRMLSSQSNIELKKLKTGKLNENDWPRIVETMAVLSGLKIHIDDTPGIKISELRSKCRKLKMEKGLDLVLIDYLQLMEGEGNNESRQQEISKISRSLKILAKELNCSVVALSQLSRAPEQRADHRPILSDLRESGAIEQDADIVMFLYRDEYYNQDSEKKNIGEVIIAKNRHGETGSVELVWFGEIQKFANKVRDL